MRAALRHRCSADVKKTQRPCPAGCIDGFRQFFGRDVGFVAIRQRCFQRKKVSLATVLTLAGIAGGCATEEPEKPGPIVRKG
ncbi:hypothetical protein [Bosea lupini]|uniref:hypothetical protein n=1 Tax=Bosea lupini TaxID=1036779 RepID=UPI001160D386|nr:hypothetical protein [Bosea lupini]